MKKILITSILFFVVVISQGQYFVQNYCGNGSAGLIDSTLAASQFNKPTGMCRDIFGNFFVADASNNCIRKIDPSGQVHIYAGSIDTGYVDGPALMARFNNPFSVCVDDSGNVFVSDFMNQRIRKISSTGMVSTVAGTGIAGFLDGPDSVAKFNYPRGIAVDHSGNIFVADSWNHRIRKIDPIAHTVSTYAGGGTVIGVGSMGSLVNGVDSIARFYTPVGIAIDPMGDLYIADAYNHRIRFIDTMRNVSVVAGSGLIGQNNGGYADGVALSSRFNTPTEVYYSADSSLYISDTYNNRIRKLAADGTVTTLAGNGIPGNINGNGSSAEFHFPRAITDNGTTDSLWVVDGDNSLIKVITKSGTMVTETSDPLLFNVYDLGSDRIEIKFFEKSGLYKIKIADLRGRIVLNTLVNDLQEFILPLENIIPGIYFLCVEVKDRSYIHKFVKK